MSTDSGYADVAAGPLYYEMRGDGPTVVLLHGANLDRRLWAPQFDTLASAYRTLRYDIRPFGRSSLPETPYSDVEDLRQLLDHRGIDSATLIGLSLGGRVAIDFALTHPSRVEGLVLVGAGVGGYAFTDESERNARYRAAFDRGGVDEVVEEWLRDPYMSPAMEHAELASVLRLIAQDNSSVWLRANRPFDSAELNPPAIDRLDEIRVPTLIIVGPRDVAGIHVVADLLDQRLPMATRVVIPGAGHVVNMEAPDAFNEEVFEFLSSSVRHP
jgi:pimeloyl-ACP methyl ester carboxylesterase